MKRNSFEQKRLALFIALAKAAGLKLTHSIFSPTIASSAKYEIRVDWAIFKKAQDPAEGISFFSSNGEGFEQIPQAQFVEETISVSLVAALVESGTLAPFEALSIIQTIVNPNTGELYTAGAAETLLAVWGF